MESLLRVGVFLIFGGILLLANIWFVRQAFDNFFRPGIVIAPFELVGQGGDAAMGKTLANLLQARLQQVLRELEGAQSSLRNPPSAPAGQTSAEVEKPDSNAPPPPPMPAFWRPIRLNTALFSPVDMKLAVGGVEVGSVLPWVQRAIVKRDMLTFTVSYEAGKAVIAGDISALHTGTASVWTETAAATPTKIADLLAHEIILRKLATDPNSRLGALDAAEFQVLSGTLLATARLNSRIAQGRIVREDFAQLVPGIEGLIQKVPDWGDLLFLAGTIAENAGADDKALLFYAKLDVLLHKKKAAPGSELELVQLVEAKLKELRSALPKGFLAGLGRQMLSLLGIFEVGSDDPPRLFGTIYAAGNDDVSFGVAGWSFKTGTLGPLLRRFQETDPVLFSELMAGGEAQLQAVLTGDRESGLAFARQILGPDHKVVEPWKSRFEALGREAKFQEVEVTALEPWFKRAVALADEYGLRSARGLMFCFNVVVQQGGIRGSKKEAVANRFTEFRKAHSREPDEAEQINMMADVLSELANPKFRRNVEARMRIIANGGGSFLGRNLEAGKYGLGLVDFRTGKAVAVHTGGA